jgi:hypothetical protein
VSALTNLKEKLSTFLATKPVRYGVTGFATAVIGYGVFALGTPVYHEYQTSFAAREFKQYGVLGTYQKHFFGFTLKLHNFEELDRTNQDLNRRLASLEKNLEVEKLKAEETEAKTTTEINTAKFKNENMADQPAVLQSFTYDVPDRMPLDELYTIALGYFRKQEFEKTVVILHALVSQKDDLNYQRADVYLLDAIAWYKLHHLQFAVHDLQQVVEQSTEASEMRRKAILWQAIVAQTNQDGKESQRLLNLLVSRYPHSDEAAWINHAPVVAEKMVKGPAPAAEKEVKVEANPVEPKKETAEAAHE